MTIHNKLGTSVYDFSSFKRPKNPHLERKLLDNVSDLPLPTESEQIRMVHAFIEQSKKDLSSRSTPKTGSASLFIADSTTFETFPVSLPVYVIESSTIFRIFMKIGQTYYNLTAALRTGKRIKAKIRGLGMELLSDPNISSYEANIVLFRFLTELDSSL